VLEFVSRLTFLLGLVLGLAILNLWRKRRETRTRLLWVTIPFVALMLTSIPAVAYLALGTLEWSYPVAGDLAGRPDMLVVLSGSLHVTEGGRREQAALAPDTYYRCLHALRLYRQVGGCPLLLSGGMVEGCPEGPALAEGMYDFFIQQGVKPHELIMEKQSRTTYENALACANILAERGAQRVVLVTDAKHMWRAVLCFRKQGIQVEAAACNHYTARFRNLATDYLPSPNGAIHFLEAYHEWLGVAYYKLRGWI
jgi:uncharacterized SAM-binding protein YcdF (DUF218 family)